ncbi:MAG: hypothetical protein E6J75_14235 [Deltaproteobacteria bacterium]|nr:MAG: hypothetical protein E6J75_14235 [Deltaproteobacteria bacterium]
MVTRGLPLPLRNALAALAIAALDDDAAVAALEWLTHPGGEPPASAQEWLARLHLVERGGTALLDVHAPHAPAAAAHAARALRAAGAHRAAAPPRAADPTTAAVWRAAALWQERLFFEVDEVLEAEWKTAVGASVASSALPPLDLRALLAATAPWAAAIGAGGPLPLDAPALVLERHAALP